MLFLDEIQECPQARTALKFLAMDDRCDVIASGSLLGIKYVEWLKDAHLATMAECVGMLGIGLAAYVRENWYKLYLSDVGMLSAMYGMAVKCTILDGSLSGHMKGGIYENFICGVLERSGFPIRYYKTEQGDVEVEVVLENDDGVIPVEVRAKNGATASFDRALRMASVPYRYKFISGNVGVAAGKISLPHYMAMFICSSRGCS